MKSNATREQEITRLRATPSFQEIFGEEAEVPKGWKLSRSEMREAPPHILITNYAMLEHILLLPTNRPLLANADLNWIVLDEIHTYAGAQAIEVAFLLRRLKAHLGIQDGMVRCRGHLGLARPDRKAELADFACRLFGERFEGEECVITSRKNLHPSLSPAPAPSGLGPERWAMAGRVAEAAGEAKKNRAPLSIEDWNFELDLEGLPELRLDGLGGAPIGDALIARLGAFEEINVIARRLEGGAVPIGGACPGGVPAGRRGRDFRPDGTHRRRCLGRQRGRGRIPAPASAVSPDFPRSGPGWCCPVERSSERRPRGGDRR